MDVTQFTEKDREILLAVLRQYRAAHRYESDGNYSNRDALEQKLQQQTGALDELDRHVLMIAIVNEVPDGEMFEHFKQILGN